MTASVGTISYPCPAEPNDRLILARQIAEVKLGYARWVAAKKIRRGSLRSLNA